MSKELIRLRDLCMAFDNEHGFWRWLLHSL